MLAAGFLKLLFPDLKPTEEQFKEFVVKPAVEYTTEYAMSSINLIQNMLRLRLATSDK